MLMRRHRETPDVDPAFKLKPVDTMDDAFKKEGGAEEALTSEGALELKGDALDAALKERGLSLEGKADEKRARLAESVAADEVL